VAARTPGRMCSVALVSPIAARKADGSGQQDTANSTFELAAIFFRSLAGWGACD